MQFADFIACGFDQLVNVAAKLHYRQGVAVPIVVRLPSGGGFSGGPVPLPEPGGLVPAGAGAEGGGAGDGRGRQGAAGRARSATRTRSAILEHKGLYRHVKGEVPEGEHTVAARRGARWPARASEMTVIAYGSRRSPGAAGGRGARRGRSRCSTCARSARSTREAILASARKTGKVLVAHEATRSCGVGAEVAALITEEAFEDLDAPVRRLTAPDVPIPFSPPLEQRGAAAARRHEGGLP